MRENDPRVQAAWAQVEHAMGRYEATCREAMEGRGRVKLSGARPIAAQVEPHTHAVDRVMIIIEAPRGMWAQTDLVEHCTVEIRQVAVRDRGPDWDRRNG